MVAPVASATTVHSGSATGPLYSGSISGSNVGSMTFSSSALGTFTCTGSSLSGTLGSTGSGTITSITFTGCTSASGSCTISTTAATSTPWATALTYVSAGSGAMVWTIPVNGISMTCTLGGIPLTCKYSASSGVQGSFTNPGDVAFNGVTMHGDTCGDTQTWGADYRLVGASGVSLYVAS